MKKIMVSLVLIGHMILLSAAPSKSKEVSSGTAVPKVTSKEGSSQDYVRKQSSALISLRIPLQLDRIPAGYKIDFATSRERDESREQYQDVPERYETEYMHVIACHLKKEGASSPYIWKKVYILPGHKTIVVDFDISEADALATTSYGCLMRFCLIEDRSSIGSYKENDPAIKILNWQFIGSIE